jgi:uncharacterized protein YgfB (UPF0149 family)
LQSDRAPALGMPSREFLAGLGLPEERAKDNILKRIDEKIKEK